MSAHVTRLPSVRPHLRRDTWMQSVCAQTIAEALAGLVFCTPLARIAPSHRALLMQIAGETVLETIDEFAPASAPTPEQVWPARPRG